MNPQHEEKIEDVGSGTEITNITDAEIVSDTDIAPVTVSDTGTATETNSKKLMVAAIVFAILLIGSAGGYYYYTKVRVDTVAIVNGYKIPRKDFNDSVAMIQKTATAQGASLADASIDAEIRKQAIDTLVNNALLISAAKKAGINIDDAKVQTEYDGLVTTLGGAENLKARMTEVGLTEEKLRSNIRERLIADAYIEAQTDIESLTVTDEEITKFLDGIKTEGTKLPPLEEIKPQIQAQILSEKQQTIVTDLLTKLRGDAKIEINI
jgi:peptidyl-prolyl cis-trans isomerase SurA